MTVVGARPQFIKAASVSRVILSQYRDRVVEVMVHTGQHYDENMSDIFFEELEIPAPRYQLGVGSGPHGAMTGRMLEAIERVLVEENPDWVLVYGDTNSTLAAALASVKQHVPVAHVEAGLRSGNMAMPEEVNRILTDRVSTLLFCPTDAAVENLKNEGVREGVFKSGDVMLDVAVQVRKTRGERSAIVDRLGLEPGYFVLATCHRAENTDNRERLSAILQALSEVAGAVPVVVPLHPRTRRLIQEFGLEERTRNLLVVEPLPYNEVLSLECLAALIATDSGGMQKEAFFHGVPCVTLRDETEWVETIAAGWNRLASPATDDLARIIFDAMKQPPQERPDLYGDGNASRRIVDYIVEWQATRRLFDER